MRSVNKVIIIGNLTREPEMRETPNGQSVTTFGLATNRDWTTKSGDKKNSAEFHECVAWAKLAEICAKYLKKGNLVYVEGYLKTRSWDSPEGIKKFKTEIVVQDMIMLEKRKDGNDDFEYPSDSYVYDDIEDIIDDTGSESPVEAEEKEEEPMDEPAEEKSESPIDKDLGL